MSVFEALTDKQQKAGALQSDALNRIVNALLAAQPAEPTSILDHPLKLIRDALRDYCDLKHLHGQQADIVVQVGMDARSKDGATVNDAVIAGQRAANRLAEKMAAIRTRFNTRPDPEAA